jgi:hypothetical protein
VSAICAQAHLLSFILFYTLAIHNHSVVLWQDGSGYLDRRELDLFISDLIKERSGVSLSINMFVYIVAFSVEQLA